MLLNTLFYQSSCISLISISLFFIINSYATEKENCCLVTGSALQKQCKIHTLHEFQRIWSSPHQISTHKMKFNKEYQCMTGILQQIDVEKKNILTLKFSKSEKATYFILKDEKQISLSQALINQPVRYYYCPQTKQGFLECLAKIWDTIGCYATTHGLTGE